MHLTARIDGNGVDLMEQAVKALGSEDRAHVAFRMAINQVGAKARTATIRALAKQTGLTQKNVKNSTSPNRASASDLQYQLTATGRPLPLKLFKPVQRKFGVTAKPWGTTQRFPGAFIFAGTYKSKQPVHNGHVLRRAGKKIRPAGSAGPFQPWAIMYGPAIPIEMVKGASAQAWLKAADELPAAITTVVDKMTKGIIKG